MVPTLDDLLADDRLTAFYKSCIRAVFEIAPERGRKIGKVEIDTEVDEWISQAEEFPLVSILLEPPPAAIYIQRLSAFYFPDRDRPDLSCNLEFPDYWNLRKLRNDFVEVLEEHL